MGRQKHAAEEIINKLEEADVSSGGGCRLKKRCDISGLLMDRATNGGKSIEDCELIKRHD